MKILLLIFIILSFTISAYSDITDLTIECGYCHGYDNNAAPPLYGLEEDYLIEQLEAFRSGERIDPNEIMPMFVEELNDKEIKDIAEYFSTQ